MHRKPPPLAPLHPPQRYVSLDRLWEQVENFAGTDIPILITGETGAGKEVLARAVHEAALGAEAPFEVIHCTAIPETLFESELFGIAPKTASGVDGRAGKLESAQGGTILLDEVGEIPLSVQVKLLRVLQDSTLVPVGGREAKPLEVRWISATNRDLRRAVKEGRFREDLFYRLCGAEVTIPPLRDRMETLPELVEHFFHQLEEENGRGIRGLSIEAYRCLMACPWPGNVRELKMEVKRAYFRANPGGLIRSVHLSPGVKGGGEASGGGFASPLDHRRKPIEESAVRHALSAEAGNVTRAAKLLGITRQTLSKRLKELGFRAGEFKGK